VALIKPFRAFRYDEGKAGPLAQLVAPPYDVIDQEEQERLYRQSPYNCIRLILNRDAERYASSARYLAAWIREGILRLDPKPALYVYSVNFEAPTGGLVFSGCKREFERVGCIAALRLEEYRSGVVQPHERTFSAPKEDRLALLRACEANLSPIFGLVSRPQLALRELKSHGRPLASVDLGGSGRHTLWSIEDRDLIAHLIEVFSNEPILIADGHHRYETALHYRDERRAQDPEGAGPADYIMAFLANMDEDGLMVLPTHRVLRESAIALDQLADLIASWAKVSELEGSEAGFAELKQRLAKAAGASCVLGVVGARGRRVLLVEADWDQVPLRRDLPEPVKKLEVTALHDAILPSLAGCQATGKAAEKEIGFEKDADEVWRRVVSGEAALAFLLPPPSLERMKEVCRAGVTMPEKSTYFFPKLLSGLTFRSLDKRYQE